MVDWAHENSQIAAGASGAIFGVAGVLIVLGVLRHTVVPRAMALQLSVYMGVLIVMNIAFDFTNPQIDVRAHLGGLVVGLVLGYLLAPRASSGGSSALAVHGEEYAR
jgi:rhomboid protease GluP